MGMTMDEAIEVISDIDKAYRTFSDDEYRALRMAMDVMRTYKKFQKILQIYEKWSSDIERISEDIKIVNADAHIRIDEVVEDGNDN